MKLTPLLIVVVALLGCSKKAKAPTDPVAQKAAIAKPKPKQNPLPPPVSAPVFTLQDFDPNNADHNSTKKAIGAELGKPPAELTQEDLGQVEKLDLFAIGITDISPLAALSGLKRLNIVGNNIADLRALTGLTSLEVLYACENKISNLTGI